jgi:hypothetical protein
MKIIIVLSSSLSATTENSGIPWGSFCIVALLLLAIILIIRLNRKPDAITKRHRKNKHHIADTREGLIEYIQQSLREEDVPKTSEKQVAKDISERFDKIHSMYFLNNPEMVLLLQKEEEEILIKEAAKRYMRS